MMQHIDVRVHPERFTVNGVNSNGNPEIKSNTTPAEAGIQFMGNYHLDTDFRRYGSRV